MRSALEGTPQNFKRLIDMVSSEDRFVREPEVLKITGLSRTTRWRLERAGQFPKSYQIAPNAVAKLESEILVWMNDCTGGGADGS